MKKYKIVFELNEEEYKKYKRIVIMAHEKKITKRYSGTELFKKAILEDINKQLNNQNV